jgi:hypothetical protein
VLANDIVLPGGATAFFSDKNTGSSKPVTVSGLTLTGADAANYTLGASLGAVGNVLPALLPVSFAGADKVYDATRAATVTASDRRIAGDVLSIAFNAQFDDANSGAGKVISVSGIRVSGPDAGNYVVSPTASATARITPRPLVVSAHDATKVYGDADPVLGFAIGGAGIAGTDTLAMTLTGNLARTPGENVAGGPYAIHQGTLAATTNYVISSFVPGRLTITPRPLTVTADAATMVAGNSLPPFSASYSGFAFADTAANLNGLLSFFTTASAQSAPGLYAVTASGLSSSNYTVSYVSNTLEVTQDSTRRATGAMTTTVTTTAAPAAPGAATQPLRPPLTPNTTSTDTARMVTVESTGIKLPPGLP